MPSLLWSFLSSTVGMEAPLRLLWPGFFMRDISGRFPTISIPEEHPLLRRFGSLSWGLVFCALALSLVGLTVVWSASAELATDYLTRQTSWVGLGLLALIFGFSLNYSTLLRFAVVLYGLGLAMLVGILFFGHEAGGARSWVGFAGLGGQPADFAKLSTVLLLVRYLGVSEGRYLQQKEVLVAALIAALPAALIVLQPDLGSALILVPTVATMVWLSGIRPKMVAMIGLVILIAAAAAWTFGLRDYQRDRLLTFFSPQSDPLGSGYQLQQSKIAVGSGELLGRGFLQGTQSQLRFLPARHTDFAFAVLAEERGFVGVVAVMGLYGWFLWSGLRGGGPGARSPGVAARHGAVGGARLPCLVQHGDDDRIDADNRNSFTLHQLWWLFHPFLLLCHRTHSRRRLSPLGEPLNGDQQEDVGGA